MSRWWCSSCSGCSAGRASGTRRARPDDRRGPSRRPGDRARRGPVRGRRRQPRAVAAAGAGHRPVRARRRLGRAPATAARPRRPRRLPRGRRAAVPRAAAAGGAFRAPLVYGRPDTWAGFRDVVLARQFRATSSSPLADSAGRLARCATSRRPARSAGHPRRCRRAVTAVRQPAIRAAVGGGGALTRLRRGYENARIDRYYLGPVFFAWTWLAVLAGATAVDARRPPAPSRARGGARGAPRRAGRRAWPRRGLVAADGVALPVAPRRTRTGRGTRRWQTGWTRRSRRGPDAVVISWWSYSTPLWYGQLVEGRRPDIRSR